MSNVTLASSEVKSFSLTFIFVYIACEIIVLALHFVLQLVIYKLQTNDNQYHLIRMLSIVDSTHCIFVIGQGSYFIGAFNSGTLPNQTLMIIITLLIYIFHASPMFVTVLIVIDRWIAVKYPLRYHALVSKRKINYTASISVIFCTVILSCLFFAGGVSSITTRSVFFTNRGTLSFFIILRTVTCATIIVLGKITIRLRDASEANRPHARNLQGAEAERFDIIVELKRSVKDVFKFNIWTCVFIVPMIVITLFLLVSDGSETIFKLNFLFGLVNVLSNPIVYLTCFTKIRQYWYRKLFQRGTINANETD